MREEERLRCNGHQRSLRGEAIPRFSIGGNQGKAKLILEKAYYKLTNPELIARALGKLYLKEKNLYAAAEIFENLAEKGNLEFAIKAGKIYEKLGEKQLALDMYKKVLSLSKGKYKTWLKDKIKLLSN
jgi:uncharacterized protein HemY